MLLITLSPILVENSALVATGDGFASSRWTWEAWDLPPPREVSLEVSAPAAWVFFGSFRCRLGGPEPSWLLNIAGTSNAVVSIARFDACIEASEETVAATFDCKREGFQLSPGVRHTLFGLSSTATNVSQLSRYVLRVRRLLPRGVIWESNVERNRKPSHLACKTSRTLRIRQASKR